LLKILTTKKQSWATGWVDWGRVYV